MYATRRGSALRRIRNEFALWQVRLSSGMKDGAPVHSTALDGHHTGREKEVGAQFLILGGTMTVKDWAMLLVTLIGSGGWFLSWWNHRTLKIELRGLRGWKFRAMWRDYAKDHGIPINGEDTEED